MEKIISKFSNFTVFGYNKKDKYYWYKTMYNSKCIFYVTISILSIGLNTYKLIIIPTTLKENDINIFIDKINRTINLYNSSTT